MSQWKANCESTRGVQVQVRVVLERQSHSQKRAMSTRPLKLAVEESMTTFDQPETWSERAYGSADWVREMARQRVRVCCGGDRGWVRTALARTSAWATVTAGQPILLKRDSENVPNLGWAGYANQSGNWVNRMLWWANASHACNGKGGVRTVSSRTQAWTLIAAAQPRCRKVGGQFRPT